MTAAAFSEFAAARGLEASEGGEVRALTPALVGARVAARADGALGEGLEGTILLLQGGGGRAAATVILTRVSGSPAFMPALVCRDRAAGGGRRPAELPAERWEQTELESAGFNRRYALMAIAGQDAGLLRELFSPALIAWLEREPPDGFSFELNEGNLTISSPSHLQGEELEAFCGFAAQVARRIQAEIDEEGDLDPDLFDESRELEAIERGMSAVDWREPPASVQEAIARYRRAAARRPSVLLAALLWAVIAGGVPAALIGLAVAPAAGLVAGVLLAAVGFLIGRLIQASRYRWGGTASVSRVGLEAFARGYAGSRGLELEDRWRFHAANRDLAVPGFADHVLRGGLPGTGGLRGRFMMLGDAAELRALGQEVAHASERPLASSALLVEADHDLPAERASAVELPDEYRLAVAGRKVLVWRPVAGNLLRTAAGSDRFCANAGEVVRRVIAAGR